MVSCAPDVGNIKTIAVYCGSNIGKSPAYALAAEEFGKEMLERGIGLIYGSGKSGMMGTIAKTIADGGGRVSGFVPQFFLDIHNVEEGYGQTVIVETMHERKKLMSDGADAFVALPGGFGTMEEIIEMITWNGLGLHKKPVGLLNVNNFYQGFLQWIWHSSDEGFIPAELRDLLICEESPTKLMERLLEKRRALYANDGISP